MENEVILVTGVRGYVASHVAKSLLESGCRVRGTVRSLEDQAKLEGLQNLVPGAKHPLELVEADLNKDDGWDKAVEGCTGVIHLASPFPDVTTKQVSEEEVLGPAREGSLRVLRAVSGQKGAVKRVVLTSSFAAVFGEVNPDPDKTYSEEDWTEQDSPTLDSYTKSKAQAEKAAWDYVESLPDDEKFELSVINPTLVLGPPLLPTQKSSTSINIILGILNKTYPGVPKIQFPVCDVRDVAKAHVQAYLLPAAASHRHIICSDSIWMKDIALILAKEFRPQGYGIATSQLPYAVCWLAGLFNRGMRHNIVPRIGRSIKVDNARMVDVLGVSPTPLTTTLLDMAYAMVDMGIARKSKKYRQVGSRADPNSGEEEEEEEGKKKKEEEEEEKKEEEEEKKELEPEDKEEKTEEIKEEKKKEEEKEEKEEEEEKK